VLGKRRVELILHNPSLYPYPTLRRIDFKDAIHVARDIHHASLCKRLTVGAGTATASSKYCVLEPGVTSDAGYAHQIINASREDYELRKELIDRVVGGRDNSVAVRGCYVTFKSSNATFRDEIGMR
jgi:hypothetical protein